MRSFISPRPARLAAMAALLSVAALLFLSPAPAFAYGGTISGQSSCQAAGGTWNATYSTCTVTSLTVNSGETLVIAQGVNVVNEGTFRVYGTLVNNGSIATVPGYPFLINGTMKNYGTVNGPLSSSGAVYNYGQLFSQYPIYNFGTMYNYNGVTMANFNNYFYNYGTLVNCGLFSSSGTTYNKGTVSSITGCSSFNSFYPGTLQNFGLFKSDASVVLNGNVYNYGNVTIYGSGGMGADAWNLLFENEGSLSILGNGAFGAQFYTSLGGTLDNAAGATVTVTGVLSNFGTVNNNGVMTISGFLNNDHEQVVGGPTAVGIIYNNYRLLVTAKPFVIGEVHNGIGALLVNSGGARIENAGEILNDGGAISLQSTSTIDNSRNIDNYGAITGSGLIAGSAGSEFSNYGTVSGAIEMYVGLLYNHAGASMTFSGTAQAIQNFGTVYNYGAIASSGTMYDAPSSVFYNYGTLKSTYSVVNYGVVENHNLINSAGTFYNYDVVNDYCGAVFIGVVTGNPVIDLCVHPTSTAVSPGVATVVVGGSLGYTAVVTDTSPSPTVPTGAISWSDGGAGGTFSSPNCALVPLSSSASSCSVTYTSAAAGSVSITASYPGDSAHASSSGAASLSVLTPQQAMTALCSSVQALEAPSGPLNSGQANSLCAKLTQASKDLGAGNAKAAVNVLGAFVNEVNAYVSGGVLTSSQGAPLVAQAQAIETAIG